MTLEFTTAAKRKKPIKFTLDGEAFTFNPPKQAVFVLGVMDNEGDEATVMFEWLEKGLGKEQTQKIDKKLRAEPEEDEFDIEDLKDIIKKLIKASSGRPTT